MLINKGNAYKDGDIISFKLVNGDEIVAKLAEIIPDGYVITKPCTVMPTQQGMGLIQTMLAGDINSNITLERRHIIMHCPAVDRIQDSYIQITTGIHPVSKGGILK